MTKKQKIVIICIVVLLLALYIVTVVLAVNQDDSEPSAGSDEATPDWTSSVDSLFSAFAERVDLTGVTCNGSSVSSEFTISSNSSCTMTFSDSNLPGDEDFWKVSVENLSSTATVYTKFNTTDECSGLSSTPSASPRIELEFSDSNSSSDGSTCWLEQDDTTSFTVTESGSTLTITCTGCSSSSTILKME